MHVLPSGRSERPGRGPGAAGVEPKGPPHPPLGRAGPRHPGVPPGPAHRLVPVRSSRGAAAGRARTQVPGARERPRSAPALADHLLLRRSSLPPVGRGSVRAPRRARLDPRSRGRDRRGLSGHPRPGRGDVVRHPRHVRAGRLPAGPAVRAEQRTGPSDPRGETPHPVACGSFAHASPIFGCVLKGLRSPRRPPR